MQGEEPEQHITRLRKSLAARKWYSELQNTPSSVHITSTVFTELKNSSQYNTQLWTSGQIKKFFSLSGKIYDIKYMNKFFKKLYLVYQRKTLHYQETRQDQLKFLHQGAADTIGYNHLCLTNAQVNTRGDITIVLESAYVPNVKLLMMDDHRFLAGEGEIRELFWRTALETFHVDLTLKVCPAENFYVFNFNVYVCVNYVVC